MRDRTWDDDTIRMLRTVVGILASLLARCEAQRDAHVHEARYRALVQHSSDTIVLLDRDGRLMFSAGRSAPLGFAPESITGMNAMDFIHPDDHQVAGQALGELLNGAHTRARSRCGCATATASGSRSRSKRATCSRTRRSAASSSASATSVSDCGPRASCARARRAAHLVKNIPGAVYRCEATPPYADEFVSEAVFALTGYTAEQFLPDEVLFDELILPGHRERTDRELEDALSTRRPFVIEYPIRHRDGSVRWIVEQGQPTYDADGNPDGSTASCSTSPSASTSRSGWRTTPRTTRSPACRTGTLLLETLNRR